MFRQKKGIFPSVCVAVFLSSVNTCSAFDINTNAGTTLYTYTKDETRWTETYTPLGLKLTQGFNGHEISIVANGRMRKDLGGDSDVNGRVYYGYFQYEGFKKLVRTRVGRQYISEGGAKGTIDGLNVVIGEKRKWRASLSGGGKIIRDFGKVDLDYAAGNYLYSANAGVKIPLLPFFTWASAGFYGSKTRGAVDEQIFTIAFKEEPITRLTLNQELYYDRFIGGFTYQRYRATYRPIMPLKLYADYRYNHPRISKQTIFFAFPHEPNRTLRGGGEIEITDWLSFSTDYTTTINQPKRTWRGRAGLSNRFDYIDLYYGGLYGESRDNFIGGFLAADVPEVLPSVKGFGAGTSARYIKYVRTFDPEKPEEDMMFWDVYGNYKPCKFFTNTLGAQVLKHRDDSSDIRGYLTLEVTWDYKGK